MLRKLVLSGESETIQCIIDNNIIPFILNMLKDIANPHLMLEAAWTVANIAYGEKRQIEALINWGVLDGIEVILQSKHLKIFEQGAWVVGNISAEDLTFREKMLDKRFAQYFINVLTATRDPEIIKYSNWALSNLTRSREMTHPSQFLAFECFIKVILENDDLEVISDALQAMSELMQEKLVNTIVVSGLIPRFYKICKRNYLNILPPTIAIVNYVSSGPEDIANTIIDAGFIPFFFELLQNKSIQTSLKAEVLWILSNLTVGEPSQIDAVLAPEGNTRVLMNLCYHDNEKVRSEALYTLCNVNRGGTKYQKTMLVEHGLFKVFCDNLSNQTLKQKYIQTIIEALDKLLEIGRSHDPNGFNDFQVVLEDSGLCDTLELLLRNKSREVYSAALRLIEKHLQTIQP